MRKEIPIPQYDGVKLLNVSVDFTKGLFIAEYEQEEDKEVILVPESIGIYRCKEDFGSDGDGLYIAFNSNSQLLYCNSKYATWGVCPLHSGFEKIQCKLIPCNRNDLKAGDAVFLSSSNDFTDLDGYLKVLNDGARDFVWIDDETGINLCTEFDDENYDWYKVVPI